MKKYALCTLALVLSVLLLTGCGCSNSDPKNTQPSTLPPTTGATIMPTTEATTAPTTMATTAPTTEDTVMPTDTEGAGTENTNGTEQPTDNTENSGARNRMPAHNGN